MKKNKKYLIAGLLSFIIISFVFICKGYFPFGDTSIVWSDMHEQVLAIYYRVWDAIRGSNSLLIDFSSGGGLNLFANIGYYALSPFTFIVLLFSRSNIPLAINIIVSLKIILSSLTMLYFLDKVFKKLNDNYKIVLSLLYAFSSYSLFLFIIPSWIDIYYLFPLFVFGLKKLLDLEDKKLYIIVLSIILIVNFYLGFMILLFVILLSFIYLIIYNKENIKKAIFNLGCSSVLAIMISAVFLLPTMLSLFDSERVNMDINTLINSKTGPLSDKLLYFVSFGSLIAITLLLFKDYKKHKKVCKFLFFTFLVLLIPVLIEPIHKALHFGQYNSLAYRFGFITTFMFIISSAYYLSHISINTLGKKKIVVLSIIVTLIAFLLIYIKWGSMINDAINHITLTRSKTSFVILFLSMIITLISTFILFFYNHNNKKFTIISFYIISLSNILFLSFLYLDNHDNTGILSKQYDYMNSINDSSFLDKKYYIKEDVPFLIRNYGMVSDMNTFSTFTSLVNSNSYNVLQRLGYASYTLDTESINGNMFLDYILGNRYLISLDRIDNPYYKFVNSLDGLYYYELKDYSYGFVINKNMNILESKDSFDASNMIYESISSDKDLFDIRDINKDGEEFKVFVNGRKNLYLELFSSTDFSVKTSNFKGYNIYVNGELLYEEYPNSKCTGSINLGMFDNEEVSIKVEKIKDIDVSYIKLGMLDLDKYDSFTSNYKNNLDININNNKINIKINSDSSKTLFIPINYLKGFTSNYDLELVYNNFIGIKLNEGENIINISFVPSGLKIGALISIIGIILSILFVKFDININVLNNTFYYIYYLVYVLLIFVFYILLFLLFLISYIK